MNKKNLKYHLEMMLNELTAKDFIEDTRGYLSLDRGEVEIVKELLLVKLESLK